MLRTLANPLTAPRRTFRLRWRRLLVKSWALSRWHYRWHGHVLAGHPSDPVWYFAYGSNMHHSAFRERRGMRPTEWRIARVRGYRLRFNLEGRPKGKAAPANICADPDGEMWGVLYRITRRELLRLDATEGVPGRHYRHVLVPAEDPDGNIVSAVTYMARGLDADRAPSFRYISLLREGARAHGLPAAWVQYLDSVEHHAE
ncbi:MAG TPA: gamma-glutamylcyclotransferase family protein [Acetobacteraceae bacterium]|nr:gamma-glutamylcyclotransferase family protein [Acetobacteraceae bacterium]